MRKISRVSRHSQIRLASIFTRTDVGIPRAPKQTNFRGEDHVLSRLTSSGLAADVVHESLAAIRSVRAQGGRRYRTRDIGFGAHSSICFGTNVTARLGLTRRRSLLGRGTGPFSAK